MIPPWLVQRCQLRSRNSEDKIYVIGFDSAFSCDYMGSAEFEFGSRPASLREVCTHLDEYEIFPTSHKTDDGKGIFLIGRKSEQEDVTQAFNLMIDSNPKKRHHMKEASFFERTLHPKDDYDKRAAVDLWWDIENHWFASVSKDTAKLLLKAMAALKTRWLAEGKIK